MTPGSVVAAAVVVQGAGWLVLLIVLGASILTTVEIVVGQERRRRRAPILALSCEIHRVDASPAGAADASLGPLSVSVRNGGTSPVRAVLVGLEVFAPDGSVGSYSDVRIPRLGAGTTQSAISVDTGSTPLVGTSPVELRYTLHATDVDRRRWIRTWDDDVRRSWRT